MLELHPTHCACRDCRNRRLIRDDDAAAARDARLQPTTQKALPRTRNRPDEVRPAAKL